MFAEWYTIYYTMNIGFDLDNVFINTPPFIPSTVIEKLYIKRDHGKLLYRIPSYPEQLFRRATHLPFLRPGITHNLEVLNNLPKKENKLYLISSRFKFLEKQTKAVIKKYKLNTIFDQMYFNFENEQPHEFKNKILQQLSLDIYIDDDLSLLRYVAKHNPKTQFFWLSNHAPKNPLPGNIQMITKLSDIFSPAGIVQYHQPEKMLNKVKLKVQTLPAKRQEVKI